MEQSKIAKNFSDFVTLTSIAILVIAKFLMFQFAKRAFVLYANQLYYRVLLVSMRAVVKKKPNCMKNTSSGDRLNKSDIRKVVPSGNLFFEIARIVDVKRPKVIFLENVSNLVEHDNGRTFLVIYSSLAQFGYAVRYRVMDAHVYGNLPQPRSRIFIVAFLDYDMCERFRFPEPIDLTIGINDIVDRGEKKHGTYYYKAESDVVQKYGKRIFELDYIYRISDKGLIRVRNHYCPTLAANMGYYPDRVPIVCDDFGIRKLTHRECLDFQGFPADYGFPNTITVDDAYRQIGNSVCVPVVKRIAEQIFYVL